MLSKLVLAFLLILLASRLGLRTKWRKLLPRLERAVNIAIAVLVVAYAGQLVWMLWQKHAAR